MPDWRNFYLYGWKYLDETYKAGARHRIKEHRVYEAVFREFPAITYSATNATVSGIHNSARPNAIISFKVTPKKGYEINVDFNPNVYSITKAAIANGTISCPTSAPCGSTVTFTVTPNSGYKVNSATVTGATPTESSTDANGTKAYIFTMPANNAQISAVIVAATYRVTTKSLKPLFGTGSSSPSVNVAVGTRVTVSYSANTGYMCHGIGSTPLVSFTQKSGNYYSGTYEFTMPNSDITVTLGFGYEILPE